MVHLGDHDYVMTAPASNWMVEKLTQIAAQNYNMSDADLKGRPFNAFRNYLFSQVSVKRLHQIWVEGGEKALLKAVQEVIAI